MVSNLFQLLNRGVPFRHVLKGVGAKTAEINAYIKRRNQEIELEAELRAAKGRNAQIKVRQLENQIRSLKDSYKRMSIWPLIEAGMFTRNCASPRIRAMFIAGTLLKSTAV